MAKVISTLVTVLLLVFANQAATHLKRKGLLPAESNSGPELVVSNETHLAATSLSQQEWSSN